MKKGLLLIFYLLFFSLLSNAQVSSIADGDWSNPGTWLGGVIPDCTSGGITIAHNVTVSDARAACQMSITGGNSLAVLNGGTLTIQNGTGTDVSITGGFGGAGLLTVDGLYIMENDATMGGSITSATFKIFDDGIYRHNYTTSSGQIYNAEWQANSTLEIAGYTTNGTAPSGLGQSFRNFVWNCQNQAAFIDLAGSVTTVLEDLTVSNTGGQFLVFSDVTNYNLTVTNNVNISGNSAVAFLGFSSAASATVTIGGNLDYQSTAESWFTVDGSLIMDVAGDFLINSTSGIDMVNGLGGSGQGDININLDGDFTLTAGTFRNTAGVTDANINFDGSTDQFFTNGGSISEVVNFTVNSFSSLDMTDQAVTGPGDFTLQSNATLKVGSLQGLSTGSSGNIQVSGTRTFTAGSNIVYNGSGDQSFGDEWDAGGALNGVVVNLEIDKSTGQVDNVNSSLTTTVSNFTLTNGGYSIGPGNTLEITGDYTRTSGSLIGSSLSSLAFSGTGSLSGDLVFTDNLRLEDFTIDRSGAFTLGSDLEISALGTLSFLSTGTLNFSGFTLTINGDITGTTGGLVSTDSNDTDLVFGGTGALTTILFNGSNSLNNLTFSRTGGATYNWGSTVTVNTRIHLESGTLNHGGGLAPATGCIFEKDGGTSYTGSILSLTNSYNVEYHGTVASEGELPTNASGRLNNLLINGNVTLDKIAGINGILTLQTGTFSFNGFDVFLGGDLDNLSGSLNQGGNLLTFNGNTSLIGTNPTIFGDVQIDVSGTLNLGSGTVGFSGDVTNFGTFNPGTSTSVFNGTSTIGGTVELSLNNVEVTGSLTAPSGNFNVAGFWDSSGGSFTAPDLTSVTFNGSDQNIRSGANNFYDVIIGGTGTKTLQDAFDVNGDLTINSTLDISVNDYDINVADDWNNNGTFVQRNGMVNFDGSNVQNIQGTSVTTFHDMTILNTATFGVDIETDQNLEGILTLDPGANPRFDADGDGNTAIFTLISTGDDPAQDAAIAELPTPNRFRGNVTVQRYASGEGRIYRYLSSPVVDATVADWQDDFPISGTFTGASTGPGISSNPSMFYYDETQAGLADVGYVAYPVTANTESLDPAVGYAAFIREDASPTVIDVSGEINKGNISFSVDYTNTGSTVDDGWNLLGNPYPASIDWELMHAGASKINSTVYTRDNGGGGGVYATWNAAAGTGTNNGTKNIALGQAFWIQADNSGGGPPPTLGLDETMKVTDGSTIRFFEETSFDNLLRITLVKDDLRDEVIQYFNPNAENGYEPYDTYKLKNGLHDLSIKLSDGEYMTINTLKELSCASEVFLNIELWEETIIEIKNGADGTYKLEFQGLNSFSVNSGITLIDHFANKTFTVTEASEYEFIISDNPESYGDDRFSMLFSEYVIDTGLSVEGTEVCNEEENTTIQVFSSEPGIIYQAYLNDIAISSEITGTGEDLNIEIDLAEFVDGENEVVVKGKFDVCASVPLTNQALVTRIDQVEVEFISFETACDLTGVLSLGTLPEGSKYLVFANADDTEPMIESTESTIEFSGLSYGVNSYHVKEINSSGCESNLLETSVTVPELQTPSIVSFETDCNGNATLSLDGLEDGTEYRVYQNLEDVNPITNSTEDQIQFSDLSDGTVTYYTSIVNSLGCEGERVEASVSSLSTIPEITVSDQDVLSTNIEDADSYQWYLDGNIIEGATTNELQASSINGTVTVEVGIGTCTQVSEPLLITGIEDDLSEFGFAIYPNPVQDDLQINMEETGKEYDFKIFDQMGRLEIKGKISDRTKAIDVSKLSKGSYIFMVVSEQSTIFSSRFIKQ